eukprot:TRINITY_DN1549_c3_g5_i3.p2 TRINITY_DN1549_c3_g5~~TRINITY_DN1549_c3_g5_i3.p2  ORF type:complete len:387 (+),score=99.62 TRINITY_DN1549_c3_g5_i3:1902-3062(+)
MDPDCVMWSRCPDVHVHPSLCYDRIMRKELRPVFDLMFTIKWFVTKCVERVTKSVIVLDLENLRNNASLDRYEGDVEMSCTVKDSKGEDRYIMQRINRQKPIHELKREVNTKYSKDSTVVCFQCSNSVLVEPCPRVYHQKVPEFCDSTREKLRTIVEATVDPNRGADVKLYTFKVSQYCMEVTHPDPILLGPVFSLFHNSTEKLCDERDTDIRVTFQKAGEDWPTTFSKDKEFVERAMFSETGLALIADGYEDAFPETFWQTVAIVMDQRVVKKPKEALLYKLDCLQSARNIQQHFEDHKVPDVVFRIIEKEWYIKSPPKSWKRESDAQECFKGLLNRSTDVLSRCTFLESRFIVEFKDVLDAVECALILESVEPLPFKWEQRKCR